MVKRTVCCLSVAFILGLLHGKHRGWLYPGLLVLLICVVCASLFALGRQGKAFVSCSITAKVALVRGALCLGIFAAGAAHIQMELEVRNSLERMLSPGETVTVQGQVSRKEQKQRFSAKDGSQQVFAQEKEEPQFIYYLKNAQVHLGGKTYPGNGILVYSSSGQYVTGNLLRVEGTYLPFQISRNEGNFSEKQYQNSRKWEFRLRAESEVLVSAEQNRYELWLEKLRKKFRSVYTAAMSREDAGTLAALTLGDKTQIDAEIKGLYQKAGISHILAISGLHITMLGMGLWNVMKKCGCPQIPAALLVFSAVYSFGVMSGMEVSTKRAVGMFGLLLAAQVLGYSYDSLTALALNAVIQLWDNPFLLEYAGFLFSYMAVLGVCVVYPIIEGALEQRSSGRKERRERKRKTEIFRRVGRNIKDILLISFSIQLATLPLSLYFYYEAPGYGILVNACVLPFLGGLLFLGFLGGAASSILPVLGAWVLEPAGWILAVYRNICRFFLELPGASLILGKPGWERLMGYYGILVVCLYLTVKKGQRRWLSGIGAALCCLLLSGSSCFEIDVLDVGQGNGILIQTDTGRNFFVDGGSSDVKSVGTYRILPFLKARGISSVQGWIVSHADADHISGLCEILEQGYPVESLIVAQSMVLDQAATNLLETAKKAGCQINYVTPGMKFGTKDTVFTVLAPESARAKDAAQDRNAASLVFAVEHKGFTGIFTGDIGREQELRLLDEGILEQYGILSVDWYQAAHHGSNASNSQEILEALRPRTAVVSCGAKNNYGHPGKEAVERMQLAGSRLFYTKDQGQICIVPVKQGVQVWTYLP